MLGRISFPLSRACRALPLGTPCQQQSLRLFTEAAAERSALIVGGSGGLGTAVVDAYLAQGWNTVACDVKYGAVSVRAAVGGALTCLPARRPNASASENVALDASVCGCSVRGVRRILIVCAPTYVSRDRSTGRSMCWQWRKRSMIEGAMPRGMRSHAHPADCLTVCAASMLSSAALEAGPVGCVLRCWSSGALVACLPLVCCDRWLSELRHPVFFRRIDASIEPILCAQW